MKIIEKITESVFFKNLVNKINDLIDNSNETSNKLNFLDNVNLTNFKRLEYITEEYVTPQVYGAKGNGSHDDTKFIQKCIDDNQFVRIPRGVYKITSPIVITGDKKHIIGDGPQITIIKVEGNIDGFILENLNYSTIKDISIEGDFKFSHKDSEIVRGVTLNGIVMSGAPHTIMSRVHSKYFNGCGLAVSGTKPSYACRFVDCSFAYNGESGVDGTLVNVADNFTTSYFERCGFSYNQNAGIKISSTVTNIISGWIDGSLYPIWISKSTNLPNHITILGVDIETAKSNSVGIRIEGGAHIYISGGQLHANTALSIAQEVTNFHCDSITDDSILDIQGVVYADTTTYFLMNSSKVRPYPNKVKSIEPLNAYMCGSAKIPPNETRTIIFPWYYPYVYTISTGVTEPMKIELNYADTTESYTTIISGSLSVQKRVISIKLTNTGDTELMINPQAEALWPYPHK